MKKILTVVGARPQFIKAATVSRQLKERGIREILVHTGQHYDSNMSQVFFEEMEIPVPDFNLGIHSMSHAAMTGEMMVAIERLLITEKPNVVLVYGDTNSTMAGALASAKLQVPIAHVEAGLRSFNIRMPEEINRIVTDRLSKYLFCPTSVAVSNLQNEGMANSEQQILLTGDVMYDSVLYYRRKLSGRRTVLDTLPLKGRDFVLVTIHRAENTDDPVKLKGICGALNEIQNETAVVLPLHPRTRALIKQHSISLNVIVIDPVGYFDMLSLLENCTMVMTDSGGLQKESFFSGKPCITLRDETEWTELVDLGVNTLAGADEKKIIDLFHETRNNEVPTTTNLYGDGNAARKVVDHLMRELSS